MRAALPPVNEVGQTMHARRAVLRNLRTGEVNFTRTQKVIFGRPVAEVLAEQVAHRGARRVFLVTSNTLATATDAIARIKAALGHQFAGLVHGIRPHAPRSDVLRIVAGARTAQADLLVSVGGGSVTDATKVASLALAHDVRHVDDFEALYVRVDAEGRAVNPVTRGPDVRIIAVPTTLSGGEFNPRSGASDEARNHKQGYDHPDMAPVAIILDPALTLHTPEWVWLSTGVRAIDHAAEILASHLSNDFADGLAASALLFLQEGLTRVKAHPQDLAARLKCQIGVWQAMLAIVGGVPMGASHAIGHVLGGTCGVAHGHTSCVMLPWVMQWNAAHNPARQQRIAELLGRPGDSAADALHDLIAGLGMPRTLAEVGVTPAQFPVVAQYALHDLWLRTNPRPIKTQADVLEILNLAA